MQTENRTRLPTDALGRLLARAVEGVGDHRRLRLRIAWARRDCRQTWTGVFRPPSSIRLSLNAGNRYPLVERLNSGLYLDRRREIINGEEWHFWRQAPNQVKVKSPAELLLLGFLHEYSHFLDYQARRNTRYKQTRADKFAFATLRQRFPEIETRAARRL